MGMAEIPNCDDPVFRAWCQACGIKPGGLYAVEDVRVARLEQMMQSEMDQPDYDPYQDTADDYLIRGL